MTGIPGMLRPLFATLLVIGLIIATTIVALEVAQPPGGVVSENVPPPPNGYFALRPVGSFGSLPGDSAAAAKVRRSTWEPRRANAPFNQVMPEHLRLRRERVAMRAHDPRWNRYIIGRISGRFTGTTDEIFQWAAVKWGIPDNLFRAIAYMESDWYQRNQGDYVPDRANCLPGFRRPPCPVTFGIVGTKSTSWPGIFPWNRDSTAAAVDVLGGWLRGCYEGWVWWLRQHGNRSRGVYRAGDIWGCVGAWYSGDWHDGPPAGLNGQHYSLRAQDWIKDRPWLRPRF